MRVSYRGQLDEISVDLVMMCRWVASAVRSSTLALLEADLALAEQVISADADLDRMQADVEERAFRVMLGESWVYGVEAAVDVALLGRYYERIADHAASIGRLMIYAVTGDDPGTDT